MLEHHIAVVGLTQSGKTTLLTSLLNQLLAADESTSGYLAYWQDDQDEGARQYQQTRAELSRSQWPAKTLAKAKYRVWWRPAGGRNRPVTLHDVPGERANDLAMLLSPTLES